MNNILTFVEEKKNLSALFFYLIVSLISLTWFKNGNLIGHGDHFAAIDYFSYLKLFESAWNGNIGTGSPEISLQIHFPFSLIYLPLGFLGFSSLAISKIWVYLSLVVPGFFMFKFLDAFFGEKIGSIPKIVASSFYVFNPLLVSFPIGLTLTDFPVYLCLPICAFLVVKTFKAKTFQYKLLYSILIIFSNSLMASSFTNVSELVPFFMIIGFLYFFFLFKSKNKKQYLFLLLFVFVGTFLVNFWWIYSSFYNQILGIEYYESSLDTFDALNLTLLADAFRLFGVWSYKIGHRGIPYFLDSFYYFGFIGLFFTFLIPILCFLPLLFINNTNLYSKSLRHKILLLIFIALLGIFFSKGTSNPFGFIYNSIYNSSSLLRIFREPYSKFSLLILFSYVSLLCVAFSSLQRLIKFKYITFTLAVVFLFAFKQTAVSMFNGNIVSSHTNAAIKQQSVKVPQYWYDLKNATEKNKIKGRVLTLPKNGYYSNSYMWESGFTGRPYELFLNATPVYYKDHPPYNRGEITINELYDTYENYLKNNKEWDLVKIINLTNILNINYVLAQNDFDYRNGYYVDYSLWSPLSIQSFFESNTIFEEYSAFGNLDLFYLKKIPYITGGDLIYRLQTDPTEEDYIADLGNKKALVLYKISNDLLSEKIYVPNYFDVYGNEEEFFSLMLKEELFNKKPMFTPIEISIDTLDLDSTLKYEQINDAVYKVSLSKEYKKLPIVFSESFDKGWKLKENCNIFYCFNNIHAEHIITNFYANGWIIDNLKGKTFYIVHESQLRLKVGILISLLSFLIVSTYFLFLLKKLNIQNEANTQS